MRWVLIIMACMTVAGCVLTEDGADGAGSGRPSRGASGGSTSADFSPWLNPDAVINRAERLTTPVRGRTDRWAGTAGAVPAA